jgi:acyl-coenzyme A thioesterase PaaI-like protein
MTVEYLKKAETDLIAIATPVEQHYDWDKAGEYLVNVDVLDQHNDKVFHATITMIVSKKKK